MKIGIIGAGQIGGTLTRRFRSAGHDVWVANSRGPDTLSGLASATGATPATAREAARAGSAVVVTIPMKNVPDLPDDLFAGVPDDVVVVDTSNYYPRERDGLIPAIEAGLPESRWVEEQLGRSVTKAFNTIYADHLLRLGRAPGASDRIALPVAGDAGEARRRVAELVEAIGFTAVDAGPLAESWRQQPGTPVYGADMDARGVRDALQAASPVRPVEFRAAPEALNLGEALGRLDRFWSQKAVAAVNGNMVKLARGAGSTTWHAHPDQDELFLVRSGTLHIDLPDRTLTLGPGEVTVVPRGLEHRPHSDGIVEVVLLGRSITSTPEGGKPAWSEEEG